jgi:hypothetical protein
MYSAETHYVDTSAIRSAIKGRETQIIDALNIPWRSGKPHIRCPNPNHTDNNPSWRWDEKKACAFCTCGTYDVLNVLMKFLKLDFNNAKIRAAELLDRTDLIQTKRAHNPGCSLEDYASAKKLPIDYLRSLRLSNITYCKRNAVRIPYADESGAEVAVRIRVALAGKDKFRWRRGTKSRLYGCERLAEARKSGEITIVEGESDCQTLWYKGFPAIGLPGAGTWREDRDAKLLDSFSVINVVVEPDKGGETVSKWLAKSRIRERVRLVRVEDFKDPSGLYLDDPEHFAGRWEAALAAAVPWSVEAAGEVKKRRAAAWQGCKTLAESPNILDKVVETLKLIGLVGEERAVKLIYLAVTSRLLHRIVSIVVKGPSSGGKSFLVELVLKLFPTDAIHAFTAMSERALAYGEESLAHTMIVLYEAAGLTSGFASYLIRSLLSEGRLCYLTVEKTRDGLRPRRIEREGPTGLIVTTTAARLHPENETRLISITITDTPEQTRAILQAQAQDQGHTSDLDLEPWHSLQRFIAAAGQVRVQIRFARKLAQMIPPVAVRLRRDIEAVRTLIMAHALLHQASRERMTDGTIIATLEDYTVVRGLVADLVSEGVEGSVSKATRETVLAVAELAKEAPDGVSVTKLAKKLRLDKSATSRRVGDAITRGFLRNEEERKGRPARLTIGDPVPDEIVVLPTPEDLMRADCCNVAVLQEGIDTPPSPHVANSEDRALAEEDI